MEDWQTCDLSQIDEEAFPVTCGTCGYSLRGLADEGLCAECATPYDRRRRLWELHGPEAFAGPPAADQLRGGAGFKRAALHLLAVLGSLAGGMYLWALLVGPTNICFLPVVWFLAVTLVEVRLARRRRCRRFSGNGDS
jgi:hypothetical protein